MQKSKTENKQQTAGVTIGDVEGGIQSSTIAGRDVVIHKESDLVSVLTSLFQACRARARSVRILGRDGLVLLTCCALSLLSIQFWTINRVLSGAISAELLIRDYVGEYSAYPLQGATLALLLFTVFLALFCVQRTSITMASAMRWGVVGVLLLFLNVNSAAVERLLIGARRAPQALASAKSIWAQGNILWDESQIGLARRYYVISERLLTKIVGTGQLPAGEADCWAVLAMIKPRLGLYEEGIRAACRYLDMRAPSAFEDEAQRASKVADRGAETITEHATVQALRATLYSLAHTDSFEVAEALLSDLRSEFGTACACRASPYWLAIGPEVWAYADPRYLGDLFEGVPHALDIRDRIEGEGLGWFDTGYTSPSSSDLRYREDLQYLEDLIQRYPDDCDLDWARYFCRDYYAVAYTSADKDLRVKATYALGLRAFRLENYDEAIRNYELLVAQFPDHVWVDDARWRIAKAHFLRKEYDQALNWLDKAISDPRGGVGEACPHVDAAYVADVYMKEEEIATYLKLQRPSQDLELVLRFVLAHKRMVAGDYGAARQAFQVLAETASLAQPMVYRVRPGDNLIWLSWRFMLPSSDYQKTLEVGDSLIVPSIGEAIARHCSEMLSAIALIEELLEQGLPAAEYELGQLFLARPDLFHNPLLTNYAHVRPYARIGDSGDCFPVQHSAFGNQVASIEIMEEGLPKEYFVAHSACYRAAELLRGYCTQNPKLATADILLQIAEAYTEVAADAVLMDLEAIDELRQQATQAYRKALTLLPRGSLEHDRAMESMAAIFLQRAQAYKDPWILVPADAHKLLETYATLARENATHRLANNFLNWVAWCHCYLANYYMFSPYVDAPDPTMYFYHYQEALKVYRELAIMNPLSGITQNAQRAIPVIEEKLADPGKRTWRDIKWDW